MVKKHPTSKLTASGLIVVFWAACLSQIPDLREDYPFSYFGMYKRSILNSMHMQFSITVRPSNSDLTQEYPIGSFFLKNYLNSFYLNEIKNKNRTYQQTPNPSDNESDLISKKLDVRVLRRALFEAVGETNQSFHVELVYNQWSQLNHRTMSKPDRTIILQRAEIEPQK